MKYFVISQKVEYSRRIYQEAMMQCLKHGIPMTAAVVGLNSIGVWLVTYHY